MSMSPMEDWYDDLRRVHDALLKRIKDLNKCDSSRDFDSCAVALFADVMEGKYDSPDLSKSWPKA